MYRDHTKSNSDRKQKNRRRESHTYPVHDQYKDRRCRGNRRADPCPGGSRLRHHPLCSTDYGSCKSTEGNQKQIHIPLVADVHFDYRLAIAAIENGADKIRINPGNIGSTERIKAVVDVAKERNIPIRVGVNSGSLEKELVEKYHGVTAEGLVESALDKVHIIEELGYDNLVISIKSSDVLMCARAHELIAKTDQLSLHVGITEAGTLYSGNIKSAIGLGIILYQGIGDTIRVSVTGAPLEDIKSAKTYPKNLRDFAKEAWK